MSFRMAHCKTEELVLMVRDFHSVNVTENYLSGMNNKEIFDANSFLY